MSEEKERDKLALKKLGEWSVEKVGEGPLRRLVENFTNKSGIKWQKV